MRLSLLVRADHRGLGSQTRDLWRWLEPAKTLLVRMGRQWTSTAEHPEWYPGARESAFDGMTGRLPSADMDWLLDDADVVLTVETPYDFRLWERARSRGVTSVVVANPEFYRHASERDLPRPDVVVAPSPWRLDQMPGAVRLDQPVDRSRFPFAARGTGPIRFVHVVGRAAAYDRQGTDALLAALRHVRGLLDIVIRTQGTLTPSQRLAWQRLPAAVRPRVETGDLPDPAALYGGADVLVAPRRYGGLSLPIGEARSCGLAVLATDRDPERSWLPPECLVRASRVRSARFQGGVMHLDDADPQSLAHAMTALRDTPGLVARLSAESDRWADAMSWAALQAAWRGLLESVAPREAVTIR